MILLTVISYLYVTSVFCVSPESPYFAEAEADQYCLMPHTTKGSYIRPEGYELEYVEVLHRHHLRTPYRSNTFPQDSFAISCNDIKQFHFAEAASSAVHVYWDVQKVVKGPLLSLYEGYLNTSCQLPQITDSGLSNSKRHGQDLFLVYSQLLGFLPQQYDPDLVSFRVSTNPITSQVAGALIKGMFPQLDHVPVKVQPDAVDTLNSNYPCAGAAKLRNKIESEDEWKQHLEPRKALFERLDGISKVDPLDYEWHRWFDHYFDNLSFRKCHGLPYPCTDSGCISESDAFQVYQAGNWEYDYIYRKSSLSKSYSVSKSLFLYEVLQNINDKISNADTVVYRHNVAHDNTLASVLGALEISPKLNWPGLGSELVFEVYRNSDSRRFVRILYGGVSLATSAKDFKAWDMVPLESFTDYIHETFGKDGEKLASICKS